MSIFNKSFNSGFKMQNRKGNSERCLPKLISKQSLETTTKNIIVDSYVISVILYAVLFRFTAYSY